MRSMGLKWIGLTAFMALSMSCRHSNQVKAAEPEPGQPSASPSLPVQETHPDGTWQSAVDGILALTRAFGDPDQQQTDCLTAGEGNFDVSCYFKILTHLSMEEGLSLDFEHVSMETTDGEYLGGYPVLRAKKADGMLLPGKALDHICLDGTEEGFFQLIVLHVMGEQFNLDWHGMYNDKRIIADLAGLEALLSEKSEITGQVLPAAIRKKARDLIADPTPKVEIKESTVLVKIVIFTHWGGFSIDSFEISRSFPHTILREESEIVIPYDCKVAF